MERVWKGFEILLYFSFLNTCEVLMFVLTLRFIKQNSVCCYVWCNWICIHIYLKNSIQLLHKVSIMLVLQSTTFQPSQQINYLFSMIMILNTTQFVVNIRLRWCSSNAFILKWQWQQQPNLILHMVGCICKMMRIRYNWTDKEYIFKLCYCKCMCT